MHPLLAEFNSHWEPLFWFALGVCGAVGLVAALHPRRISALAMRAEGSVATPTGATGTEEPTGGKSYLLAFCRLFGVAVLAAVVAAAYFLAQR